MTDLLKELEAVVALQAARILVMGVNIPSARRAAESAALRFVTTRHAEIAEAVRDAAKWRRYRAGLGDDHSHLCKSCGHYYTPTASESEDCPACGSDGIDAHNSAREAGNEQ